jgi:hypothetical protein
MTRTLTLKTQARSLVRLKSRGGTHAHRKVARGLLTMIGLVSLAVGTASAQNCTLILPADPLSAAGLSTPFRLQLGGANNCLEGDGATGAFAQAAIYDPTAHTISAYSPLIINEGQTPAIAPVVPTIPAGATVALWFGFDGNNLIISGPAAAANCVDGTTGAGTTVFSQFSYCNAVNFFAAVNADAALIASIPALGTSPASPTGDGRACPSVRDFAIVDQDMSDNLPTEYLMRTSDGFFAQNTAANRNAIGGGPSCLTNGTCTKVVNPSDERLSAVAVAPRLGCIPWKVNDLADPGATVASLATNELQSAKFTAPPIALIPLNDPMAQDNGTNNLAKVNLYRAGVDQPQAATAADADGTTYCRNIRAIHPGKLLLDKQFLVGAGSPNPATSDSLFTFMALRYVAAYQILGCDALLNQPVNLVLTFTGGVCTNARSTSR